METKNSWRKYKIAAQQKIRMVDNTFYFPGWKVYIDGKETLIEFQDMNYRGIITYYVPAGNHDILVRFEDTKVRRVANSISMATLILFITIIFIEKKFKIIQNSISS